MDLVLILCAYFTSSDVFPFHLTLLHCHIICPALSPILQPKIVEENLTYAELDLVKPIPEPKASRSGTVYAQILFGEQQL